MEVVLLSASSVSAPNNRRWQQAEHDLYNVGYFLKDYQLLKNVLLYLFGRLHQAHNFRRDFVLLGRITLFRFPNMSHLEETLSAIIFSL
jgi:hypothetical protein